MNKKLIYTLILGTFAIFACNNNATVENEVDDDNVSEVIANDSEIQQQQIADSIALEEMMKADAENALYEKENTPEKEEPKSE